MFKRDDLVPFVNEMRNSVIGYDNLWDQMLTPTWTTTWTNESFPKDNVYHVGDNEIVIEIALAGYHKDDINISRDNNSVVVTGEREDSTKSNDIKVIRKNIAARSFTKLYTVAAEYDKASASFDDGILSIVFERKPKKEEKSSIKIV
jgi:molecular chaperone IbpA